METLHLRAMNTDVLLAAEGQADQLRAGFEQAREFILASESRFTRFSEDSELSALNRHPEGGSRPPRICFRLLR